MRPFQERLFFRRVQNIEGINGKITPPIQLPDDVSEIGDKAVHCGRGQYPGTILDKTRQAPPDFSERDIQVELRRAVVVDKRPRIPGFGAPVLNLFLVQHIEHHVKQRISTGVAGKGEFVHQFLERILLILEVRQSPRPHLRHKLVHGFVPRRKMPEGESVGKHADDPLQVRVTAGGDGDPHHNILLTGEFG